MIKDFVTGISDQMGFKLSKISLVRGQPLGCNDVHLLNLSANGYVVGALVFQSDIDNLERGEKCESLEVRMRSSLSRLQCLMER